MAIKAQKASFSLTAGSVKESSYPTISLTTAATTSNLSDEDKSAADNTEASVKFQRIARQGLNPLKPVIIANTEFVPIGTGNTSPDATGLNIQFDENNIINVNSVTKLIELHRQIRKSTLRSAETILSNAKGYNVDQVVDFIVKKARIGIKTFGRNTMEETIDACIKYLASSTSKSINTSTKNKKRKSTQEISKKNGGARGSGRSSIGKLSNRVKMLAATKPDDPFFRTLIEYAIMQIVLFDAIKYLSGILTIKDAAERSWSILEASSTTKGSELNTNSLPPAVRKYLEETGLFGWGWGQQAADTFLENKIGFEISSTTPDITVLIQTFLNAFDALDLTCGFTEDLVGNAIKIQEEPESLTKGKHVKRALAELRQMSVVGLYSDLTINGEHKLSMMNPTHDFFIRSHLIMRDQNFNSDKLKKVFDHFPHKVSDSDAIAEMLAACMFNDAFAIAQKGLSSMEKSSAFAALGGSATVSSIPDYYYALLGREFAGSRVSASSTSGVTFDYNLFKSRQSGHLLNFLKAKDSNSSTDEDLPNYIPLESFTSKESEPFMTGPEYFFDLALQRGDENFIEFRKFAKQYKEFAFEYVKNIDNMTKLWEVEDSFKSICKTIGNELRPNNDKEDLKDKAFLLSLIAINGGSRTGLCRLFSSAYFGAILSSKEGKEGYGNGYTGDWGDPFIKLPDWKVTREQARRRVMRYANQVIVERLLDNTVDLNKHKMKTSDSHGFVHLSGPEVGSALKPKEYLEKDKDFDVISGHKNFNEGTGVTVTDLPDPPPPGQTAADAHNALNIHYKINKQSGKKFGTPSGGLNKEFTLLEGGAFWNQSHAGSLKAFIDNRHFFHGGMFPLAKISDFNSSRKNTKLNPNDAHSDNLVFVPVSRVRSQGASIELSEHQRMFLIYAFVAKIINKSLTVWGSSHNPSKSNNAAIFISTSKQEIEGMSLAFLDFAEGSTRGWSDTSDDRATVQALQKSYYNTYEELTKVRKAIRERVKFVSSNVVAPAIHADILYKQYEKIRSYIKEGDGSTRSKLAISMLKNRNISAYFKTLDLLSDESVSQMYKSYLSTIKNSTNSYTAEDTYDRNESKLMIKILTNSGYGLLSSEKRGPKTVCHVGVTNSLLTTLRYEAYKETDNKDFLDSRRFCINLFKRDEMDSQLMVYPKTYLFDSSYNIINKKETGERLGHLTNYLDTWKFSDIIDNVEFTRWVNTLDEQEASDPFDNLKTSFQAKFINGKTLKSQGVEEDLIINHLYDYALKLYYKMVLGVDFNEQTFLLEEKDLEKGSIPGGITDTRLQMQNDYDTLINQLELMYPAANVNQELANELFRSIQIIAANPIYDLKNKVKRTLYPKKFDRVMSILLNEKDFVLYTPVYDKEFEDIYKTGPNFSYTSRICRPEMNSIIKGETFNKVKFLNSPNSSNFNMSPSRKYKNQVGEDFPEVFSLYATITILPKGSM